MARAKHAQIEQLSFGLVITDPDAHRLHAMRRLRKCLHCSDNFPSDGPGHRICPPCKGLEVFTSSPSSFSVYASF